MNPIEQARELGYAVWLDYLRRALVESGELKRLVGLGISGLTANPTIMERAIIASTDYDEALLALIRMEKTPKEIYETLAIEDIRACADLLRPVYDGSGGKDGFTCLEITPMVAYDTEGTIREARELFAALGRPNVMVRVPATPQGIPAIRQLTSEGININATLIFSLGAYEAVQEAYIAGLEELIRGGGEPGMVCSVASFSLSQIDAAVDSLLEARIKQGDTSLRALLGRAAIASARLAYHSFTSTFRGERFAALQTGGASAQRLLWASTGTKNPAYGDLMYVEPLIGSDSVNNMPLATLHAFLDHGHVEATMERDMAGAELVFEDLASAGINIREITDRLLADGVRALSDSFEKLIAGIEEKRARLVTPEPARVRSSFREYEKDVQKVIDSLEQADVAGRIWRKDHTVWKPEPTEITNRLGWLTATDLMLEQVPNLHAFAEEVRKAGFRHIVLLGMGGSSLGAEVLRQVFGSGSGYPQLIVLDSTVPGAVRSVAEAVSPEKTLFLVSSKSGTTTEPLMLYRYFRSLVERDLSSGSAGKNFAAITDRGTPLAEQAEDEGFRHIFLNPPDIGGRYSVLSFFGLVPAAVMGIHIRALLERADAMREGCAACVPESQSPGCLLGAYMGTLASKGRDKLTLVTSPSLASFGLWAEQLIAESTGKGGKGIVPVAGEPLAEPFQYGSDRMFVYLRLNGDENSAIDAVVNGIRSSGQPLVVLEMQDKYDLGAEFLRWEFATAVAGAILGMNPFDQPDVQKTKTATERLLQDFARSSQAPRLVSVGSLDALLRGGGAGKYFAIMAYLHPMPEIDDALGRLRHRVMTKRRMPTTLGYGPRFLHSTGQLHKGGPDNGLFLQLTAPHERDVPIPGSPFSFGMLADAQALGDFEALQEAGRQVVRIHAPGGDLASIARLIDGLM